MRRILFVSLALILPLAAAAEPFGLPLLQKTCARLKSDGWTAPKRELTITELTDSGITFSCTLTHVLQPKGSGHAPELEALLSSATHGPNIFLSATIWCAADRTATFDALAKEVERTAGSVPERISSGIRAGESAKATADGLIFEVAPTQLNLAACESVPAGQLGPPLMRLDVLVKRIENCDGCS
jgi:hypothetical protein